MTGMANRSSICTTNAIQVKIGIFIIDMPGARMLSTVTIKLIAPTNEAIPVICSPSAQKSTPLVGLNGTELFGAYMNQPPSAPPPRNHDVLRNTPPKTKTHSDSALRRGNATSRAPICNGMK